MIHFLIHLTIFGTRFALYLGMKMIILSADDKLRHLIEAHEHWPGDIQIGFFGSNDLLKAVSTVCEARPRILVLDNDLMKPHSADLLSTIKKMVQNVSVIFLTSDVSIELGREISQLGIQLYAMKPIDKNELIESIESIAMMHMRYGHENSNIV